MNGRSIGREVEEMLGQRRMENGTRLPVDGSEVHVPRFWWATRRGRIAKRHQEAIEATGIIFGDYAPGALMRPATLPEGWTITRDEGSSFWTYIRDEGGNIRAEVFYKASESRAHMSIIARR